MKTNLLTLSAAALLAAPFAVARADLVFVGLATVGGTGLGAVNTVLTIQQSPTELGCVSYTAGGDVLGGTFNGFGVCTGTGDDKTGASQTQTQLLSVTGVTNAGNFAILFNPAEPGSDQQITLNTLVASFYNATTGGLLFSAGCAATSCPQTFNTLDNGTGTTGFEFALDAGSQATLAGWLAAMPTSNIRVGLSASAGTPVSSDAGNETFFVFNSGAATTTPEPSTTVLMATGLFGLVGFVRRRRRS